MYEFGKMQWQILFAPLASLKQLHNKNQTLRVCPSEREISAAVCKY